MVGNICNPILFKHIRLRFFYVREVHVVPALDPLVLSIYIHIGSADVFHVELVVLKSPLGGGFRDVWGQ